MSCSSSCEFSALAKGRVVEPGIASAPGTKMCAMRGCQPITQANFSWLETIKSTLTQQIYFYIYDSLKFALQLPRHWLPLLDVDARLAASAAAASAIGYRTASSSKMVASIPSISFSA